jgi:hypothetical protein
VIGWTARAVRRVAIAGACALVATGCASASPPPGSGPVGSHSVSVTQTPAAPPATDLTATTVDIPAIAVHAALDRLAIGAGGVLEKPPHWNSPGWFSGGTVPGDLGPAIIAGHVDSPTGPAVFWRLKDLKIGDLISVRRSDQTTVKFRVTRSVQYSQAQFPTAEVYGPTPDSELRLITCDGTYDHAARRYRDNRVVYAVAM